MQGVDLKHQQSCTGSLGLQSPAYMSLVRGSCPSASLDVSRAWIQYKLCNRSDHNLIWPPLAGLGSAYQETERLLKNIDNVVPKYSGSRKKNQALVSNLLLLYSEALNDHSQPGRNLTVTCSWKHETQKRSPTDLEFGAFQSAFMIWTAAIVYHTFTCNFSSSRMHEFNVFWFISC